MRSFTHPLFIICFGLQRQIRVIRFRPLERPIRAVSGYNDNFLDLMLRPQMPLINQRTRRAGTKHQIGCREVRWACCRIVILNQRI